MLTSEMIKQAALAAGADKCGIAPMSRFEGAPPEMDPRYLFPEAKSCIGFVFRIPRGVQRGIEEGTQFYQYPSMAYGGINEIFAPAVLYQVGKLIEDEDIAVFEDKWRLVEFTDSGAVDETLLHGVRRSKNGSTALVRTEDAAKLQLNAQKTDLETIMVHLEKEEAV